MYRTNIFRSSILLTTALVIGSWACELAAVGADGGTMKATADTKNTGARVSEIIGLHVADLSSSNFQAAHLKGKGRKDRRVPLWKTSCGYALLWGPNTACG